MALHDKYINEIRDNNGEITKITFNIPESFNFAYDVVDKIAAEKPDKLAIMWCNKHGDEKRITFADIKRESDKAAAFFVSLGVKKNDRVMVTLKRHYEFWYVIIALHKIGAVCIPATVQLSAEDLVYRFKAANVSVIVSTPEDGIADRIDQAEGEYNGLRHKIIVRTNRDGWINYDEAVENAPEFVKPSKCDLPENNDMMLLYFTSGTTGMPKMVAHDYTYPIGHIVTAKHWHKVDPDGLHLTIAETGWAKSVWGKLYGQWFMEAAIFVYDFDRFVAEDVLSKIEKYKITTFCAPPTMFRFFIKSDLENYDLSSLKHTTIAGEALNPEVFEQFKKATGLKLMEGFGQTETTVSVFTPYWLEPKPGSMGKPSPAYDVEIVDENNKKISAGIVGEIVIKTNGGKVPGMFSGYHKDEALTSSVWHDGIYHTGDTAWYDEDGYFWYVGRTDDLIKSSGYRIGPFEVESVLMELPCVLECAVTGAPDPVRGQVVKATIVLAKGYEPSEELKKEIQNYVKTHTAFYKYPRIIEFTDELPKTISGKIKRKDLRQADEGK